MTYRADVDGLRAIAVMLVLLFHLGFAPLSGGFVGVDVFFVISGYLITSNIVSASDAGSFSLLDFYDRRIRRIFPALLAVVGTTCGVGYFVLTPGDYLNLGQSAAYTSASIGNLYFLWHTGYFDAAADLMPLLHTWSLAVEEQFYVVWPLFLLGVTRLSGGSRLSLLCSIVACAVLSLLASIYQVATDPKAAFFLPHTRAWELAIGAILAVAQNVAWTFRAGALVNVLKLIGLGLIAASALVLTPESTFPGLNALAPTIGAFLLLIPTGGSTWVARLLAIEPLPFIGRISYSLYLWHWPIIVFWRHYANGAALSSGEAILILALSVLAAWASWRWIETPFRNRRYDKRFVVGAGILASSAVAAVGLAIVALKGFPQRIPDQIQALRSRDVMWDWNCPQNVKVKEGWGAGMCAVGAKWEEASSRALIWGDSHAEHLMPLLDAAGRQTDTAILLFRACPAIISESGIRREYPGYPAYNKACDESRARAVRILNSEPEIDTVLLAAAWPYLVGRIHRDGSAPPSGTEALTLVKEGIEDLMPEISRPQRRVVVLGDTPHWAFDPIPCVVARDGSLLRRECQADASAVPYDGAQKTMNEALRSLHNSRNGLEVAILADHLCDEAKCLADLGGEFLYRDADHLRRNLSPETAQQFALRLGLETILITGREP